MRFQIDTLFCTFSRQGTETAVKENILEHLYCIQ